MKDLNKEVLAEAIQNDICEPWAEMIKNADIHKLLQMYNDGIDFCLSNNFPSNEFLKAKAGDLLADYGIYIDEEVNLKNPVKAVFLGKSNTYLSILDYTVSQIFIKHKSEAEINVTNDAFVVIDAFDDVVLNISAYGESKVLVNLFGRAKISHQTAGNAIIKVIRKLKDTY